MTKTMSQRLTTKLREKGFTIPDNAEIVRTYAGRHQKAQGACGWFLTTYSENSVQTGPLFTSQWTVTEILKKDFTVHKNKYSGDFDIFPTDEA